MLGRRLLRTISVPPLELSVHCAREPCTFGASRNRHCHQRVACQAAAASCVGSTALVLGSRRRGGGFTKLRAIAPCSPRPWLWCCRLRRRRASGREREAGTYKVEIVDASFPTKQRLADQAQMQIVVRNAGTRRSPTSPSRSAVTDQGRRRLRRPLRPAGLADPARPVWIVDDGPRGGTTAYVNTWALGALAGRPDQDLHVARHRRCAPARTRCAAGRGRPRRQGQGPLRRRPAGRRSRRVSDEPARRRSTRRPATSSARAEPRHRSGRGRHVAVTPGRTAPVRHGGAQAPPG